MKKSDLFPIATPDKDGLISKSYISSLIKSGILNTTDLQNYAGYYSSGSNLQNKQKNLIGKFVGLDGAGKFAYADIKLSMRSSGLVKMSLFLDFRGGLFLSKIVQSEIAEDLRVELYNEGNGIIALYCNRQKDDAVAVYYRALITDFENFSTIDSGKTMTPQGSLFYGFTISAFQ